MSLSGCLKKAGKNLREDDKAAVLALARQYRNDGMSANDAGLAAIGEHIKTVDSLITQAQAKPEAANDAAPASLKAQFTKRGDFFQYTGDRAKEIAKVIGMTVTKGRDGQPSVGFPTYLQGDITKQMQDAGISATFDSPDAGIGLTAPTKQEVLDQQQRAADGEKANASQRKAEQERLRRDAERKDIAKASEAAADTFELGGNAEQNLSGQEVMFSRAPEGAIAPRSPNPGATPLYEAMRQLSRFEDSFFTATSNSQELGNIASEITAKKSYEGKVFTADKGTALHQGNRKPTLSLKIKLQSGEEVKLLDIFEAASDKPFVVIGNSDAGQKVDGATAYQIAFAWAHNNGKTMRPDPAGLTVINRLRRTEAMISSAMHYGTTAHLEPHQDQYVGLLQRMKNGGTEPQDTHYSGRPDIYNDLEALKEKLWTTKTDAASIATNVQHLLEASAQLTYSREPATRNFEVVDGQLRLRSGREGALSLANLEAAGQVDSKEILGVVLRPAATGVGAGTLRRAAISGSVARAIGKTLATDNLERQVGSGERAGVVALQAIRQVLGRPDLSASDGLRSTFYSRAEDQVAAAQSARLEAAAQLPRLANQAGAKALNKTLVNYGLGQDWSNAYEAVKLPDALSGVRQAIQTAFGRDVRAVAPTADKFNIFNGVYIASEPNAVYVNTAADVGFINIAGHELSHVIEAQRPDLMQWYRQHSRQFYKDLPAYQDKLNALLQDGEKKYSLEKAESELEGDFLGDSLADPAFLQQLAKASPANFKELMNRISAWLAGVAKKLASLGSTKEVTDVKALQSYLKEVLVAFAENKRFPDAPSNITSVFSRTEQNVVGNQGGRSADDTPKLNEDIPSEYWLNEKIGYAKSKGRDRFGAPHFGATTGWFGQKFGHAKTIQVSVDELAKLKGLRGEQTDVREDDLSAIKKIMSDTGRLPLNSNGEEYVPYIEVAYNGEAWVSEGNHRIIAAKALGWKTLPVEIKYFDGGQRLQSGPLYPQKIQNEPTAPGSGSKPIAQTDTPAFKKWFGNSKVVDAQGKPLVVYHGTAADFDSFDNSKTGANDRGLWGRGHYFSAVIGGPNSYALRQGDAARVIPAYVSIKNPLVLKTGSDFVTRLPDGTNHKELVGPNLDGAKIKELAISGGHDGVIQIRPNGLIGDVVAYNPEQIKSSIGNSGEFDPANPDIRFSREGQPSLFQPNIWSTPEPTRTDRIIYELQDSKVDLKRTQEAIVKSGQTIAEKYDARLAETLYPGRVAYRSQSFLESEAKPVLELMTRSKVAMDELGDYLHARGAEERNVQIAKVNPDMPDGGAGTNSKGVLLTTQVARDYLANIRPDRKVVLDAVAKRVDAIMAGTRQMLVTEGLEKQDTIDAWTAAYKNYVPMYRDEAESGTPTHSTGSGFTVRGSASKRATGSTKEVTNIFAHVLMQREAAITRAEKNRVAVALYGLALSHPNPEFWTTIKPNMDAAQISAELTAMGVDPVTAEVGMKGVPTVRTVDKATGKVVDRPNPMYRDLDGAIPLKVNGEDRVLMLNTKGERGARLAASLKNLDGLTQLDIAGSVIGKSTRWLASVNTQYNPAFGLVNLTRDVLGGSINLGSTELRGNALKVLSNTPMAILGIARELASGNQTGKWQTLYRQFQADGGQTGYKENFRDANDRAKAVEKEIASLQRAGKFSGGRAAHAMLDLLDGFNTSLENSVRLSAYSAALDKGVSRANAARLGRELTVDFNRKGRAGREIGPLYAFFNASVQGIARGIVTMKGPTGKKVIFGGLSLGVMQALMLAAAGYDDDEIPEFVKTRALIIPMFDAKKTYITIAYPMEIAMLPNTGRVITELALSGGKDIRKKLTEAIGTIAGSFNPLGGGNIFTMDGALKTIAPTVVDPLIEMGFNRNFAGGKIEKEAYGGERDNRPGVDRTKESTMRSTTGQVYMSISKAMNSLTGGTDYEKGEVSPTPELIRYLAQTVGGGVLREIEKTINASTAAARGDAVKKSQIPVLGRFNGEVDADQVQQSRYFKQALELDKLESSIKAAKGAGDAEALQKLYNDHPEVALMSAQNHIQASLSKLNKLAVTIVKNHDDVKAVDEARVQTMTVFNEAVKELEAQSGKETLGEKFKKAVGAAPRQAVAP